MTARLRARSETVSAGPGITRTLPNPDPMAFDLPPLPYDYDALEPLAKQVDVVAETAVAVGPRR